MKFLKKVGVSALSLATAFSTALAIPTRPVSAAEEFRGQLESVDSVDANGNVVNVSYNNGAVTGKITFLENGIFRYNVDPTGEFEEYAEVRKDIPGWQNHTATIQAQSDESDKYSHPDANVSDKGTTWEISTADATIVLDKATAKMSIKNKDGKTIMSEVQPLVIGNQTVQSLNTNDDEYFFGGGTQNGRFTHKGKSINIANESGWTDGEVSSPNPFYWSTEGYGVLRNTFQDGKYDFGEASKEVIATTHNESEFDAYYFVSNDAEVNDKAETLLSDYYEVTGNPLLLPEYAFYLAHLNCYNRDAWEESTDGSGWTLEDGNKYKELGQAEGYVIPEGKAAETLNNEAPSVDAENFKGVVNEDTYKYSARAVIDGYEDNDMPLGWFLPNDGYGCGYGQNGYYQKRNDGEDTTRMNEAIDANVENLRKFTEYAEANGVRTGLWTQAALTPEDSERDSHYQGFQTLRDFRKEVGVAGVSALKTDVAWVGYGYSMALNSVKDGYNISATSGKRPNLVSLDGWAGFQRYAGTWTGDQTGGNWEYIRFHIPTYIGQSLAGNPNVGSDVDGIFGGTNLITTRDLQFKTFTPTMLDMDGWGSIPKKPHISTDPYKSINRMYLKLKAQLMPYIYTYAQEAVDGLPMIRAMFLEEPNDYTYSTATQYQYMFGDNFLVAPVYQDTNADEVGNDVRNNIYLPETSDIWIDYFTGKQYSGGQIVNNFDAPIWKLPLFVKNGSIIPMYEENNNPMAISETNEKGLDKTRRIVEFYPYGETSFDLLEDDGISLDYDEATNERDYGGKVTTHITSKVEGDKATLTIGASKGSYEGYDANRHTTFVVNVSEKPDSLEAKNGNDAVDLREVSSYEEFEAAAANNEAVWFYDETPNLNKYSADDEAFKDTEITTTPKVYVSFTKTNVDDNAQTLVVNGFINDGNLSADQINEDLAVPANLAAPEEQITPTSIDVTWDPVEGATSYELLIDGKLSTVGNFNSFKHTELAYDSEHTYQVRARNVDGYSPWSEEITVRTLLDPWRNTLEVKNIDWPNSVTYGSMSNAFDHDNETTGFQSPMTNGNSIVFDYGNGYLLDKFEFVPFFIGDTIYAGLVTKMDISVSLDGKHWQKVFDGNENPWAYDKSIKTVNFGENVFARYIKLTILEGGNNYFSANGLHLYKKDLTNPFAVGSIANQGRTEVINADYTNLSNYKGLSIKDDPSFTNQIKNYGMDINMNNIYDVYDYAFTMFKLDGGTTKQGSIAGNALLLPNTETVKAGETFTIDVYADNVKNLNAIGQVINYDPSKVDYVSIDQDDSICTMEDLSVNKVYDDGTAYLNMAFANRGDKDVYNGSGVVATITMMAKQDIAVADAVDLSKVTLIGPDFSFVESDVANAPEIPEIPDITKTYYEFDDFNISMTNEYFPEDDGTNVEKLIQGGSYDSYATLFNGSFGREFEFLWDVESNYVDGKFPEYVKLPMTLHFDLKTPSKLNEVSVFNSETEGNGYLTSAKAQLIFEDGTRSEEITLENQGFEFVFTWDSDKTVTGVDVTALTAKGSEDNHMLTLGEVQLKYVEEINVEGIAPADTNATELKVGQLSDINAVVTPDNAPNKFFKVESSNPDVVKIVTLADENGYPIYKAYGVKAGKATITLISAADENITASYEITVTKDGEPIITPDKKLLSIAVEVASQITEEDLKDVIPAVVNEFNAALVEAQNILADENATQEQINASFDRLAHAMHMLDFIKGDKTALKVFIDKVTGLEADKYTEATWTTFAKELDEANAVYNDENAMQEEVNNAYKELVTAFLDLRLKPNKDLLEDLINKAENINTASYTAETVRILNSALENAKAVLNNEDVDQTVVNEAYAMLNNAFEGLVAVNSGNPTTPNLPINPATPNDSQANVKLGDTTVSVKTGDAADFTCVTTLGASLAVLAYLAVSKKRKED